VLVLSLVEAVLVVVGCRLVVEELPSVEELLGVEELVVVKELVLMKLLVGTDDVVVVVQGTGSPAVQTLSSQWSPSVQSSPSSQGHPSGLSAHPLGSQSGIDALMTSPDTPILVSSRVTGAMQSTGMRKASIIGVTASG
jgi:hypothetical protein